MYRVCPLALVRPAHGPVLSLGDGACAVLQLWARATCSLPWLFICSLPLFPETRWMAQAGTLRPGEGYLLFPGYLPEQHPQSEPSLGESCHRRTDLKEPLSSAATFPKEACARRIC